MTAWGGGGSDAHPGACGVETLSPRPALTGIPTCRAWSHALAFSPTPSKYCRYAPFLESSSCGVAKSGVLPKTRERARRSPGRGVTCETWPGWSRTPSEPVLGRPAGQARSRSQRWATRDPTQRATRPGRPARVHPPRTPPCGPRSPGPPEAVSAGSVVTPGLPSPLPCSGALKPLPRLSPPCLFFRDLGVGRSAQRDRSSASARSLRPPRRRPLSPHPVPRRRHAPCLARPPPARRAVPSASQGQRQDSFPAEGRGAREP